MDDTSNRRQLSVRETGAAQKTARWLSQKSITPNQISLTSVVFALLGFMCLVGYRYSHLSLLLIMSAAFIQLRLLCNLFDGMVAVEGGKKTAVGELFNDLPDRITDPLFIVGAGFVTHGGNEWLGWLCALLAVLTAYIRILGVSMGCPADFQGPMAKQHRMAILTVILIIMFIATLFNAPASITGSLMTATLYLMLIGMLVTCFNRILGIMKYKSEDGENA
ncbi:CDP-alcohol phosphatidyltransferase family protein [Vibrio harveyi]|uniref:CDP-alcohol phosphatidyltransferase family protein n=1 Tax=Vibrio harveyi TaxID=669 RepID=UPI003CF41399